MLSDEDIASVKSEATAGTFSTEGSGDQLMIGNGFMGIQRVKTATAVRVARLEACNFLHRNVWLAA